MRSTTYTIPNASDMVKQSNIPVALAISPLADLRPDEVICFQSFYVLKIKGDFYFFSLNHQLLVLVK